MNYNELRQELKSLRDQGKISVDTKLNQTKNALETIYFDYLETVIKAQESEQQEEKSKNIAVTTVRELEGAIAPIAEFVNEDGRGAEETHYLYFQKGCVSVVRQFQTVYNVRTDFLDNLSVRVGIKPRELRSHLLGLDPLTPVTLNFSAVTRCDLQIGDSVSSYLDAIDGYSANVDSSQFHVIAESDQLVQAVQNIAHAASRELSKGSLAGVCVDGDRVFATDHNVFAQVDLNLNFNYPIIIHPWFEVAGLLSKMTGSAQLLACGNWNGISSGRYEVIWKRPLDTEDLASSGEKKFDQPRRSEWSAKVDRAVLLTAMDTLCAETKRCLFYFQDKTYTIQDTSAKGVAEVRLPCKQAVITGLGSPTSRLEVPLSIFEIPVSLQTHSESEPVAMIFDPANLRSLLLSVQADMITLSLDSSLSMGFGRRVLRVQGSNHDFFGKLALIAPPALSVN